jgi:uncharacterized membrane protein
LGFFEFLTDFSKRIERIERIERIGFLLLGLFFIIAGACFEYYFLGAILSSIGMAMLAYAVIPRKIRESELKKSYVSNTIFIF